MPAASQTFWKLRVPASVPFLFTSMKVAVAASLVGAIVGELPTGAVAGIGAKLLSGSYYSQTIDIWAALVAGSRRGGAAGDRSSASPGASSSARWERGRHERAQAILAGGAGDRAVVARHVAGAMSLPEADALADPTTAMTIPTSDRRR